MRNPVKAVAGFIVDGGRAVVEGKLNPSEYHRGVTDFATGMHPDMKRKVSDELSRLGFRQNPEAGLDSAAIFLKNRTKQ